jgi:hypothetical protein
MKRLLSTCFAMITAAIPALAHVSVAPHEHPHDASMLPDLSTMLIAALIVGCAAFALRNLGRSP